jgi:hypothetical protein
MSQILPVLGALLILIPFAWSTLGALQTSSPFYLWTNLAGGTALGVTAVIGQQWGSCCSRQRGCSSPPYG